MKIRIPKSGVSMALKKEIKESLPTPKEYAGWRFKYYEWIRLDQINTIKKGFTDNSVRVGGTRNDDVLEASLRKGIDISKLTMSTCPVNNLLNGFNRYKKLIKIGYQEWIVAVYEKDESTKTEFQDAEEDYVDDFRLSANDGDGAVAVTPAEITEIARKRFSKRSDKSKLAVSRYVNSLNLNLSKQAVEGIAQKVTKHYARQGVVESYTREEAEKKVKKEFKLDCEILNTKDTTRTLRIFPRLMKNFIRNHSPLEYVDFHSDATTHKEIEDGRLDSQGELLEYLNLCIDYAAEVTKQGGKVSWKRLGSLAQKIGKEDSNSLIK